MKRRLITSLTIAGLLLGLLGGAGGWVIGTEAGSRWFIRQAQRWVPGELVIQNVQGRLLDELRLTGWSYRYQDFSFRAASLHLVWRIGLDGVVRVRQLDGDGVEMHIPPFSDEAILLPNVILPLRRLELNQVQFKPMTVQYVDKTPFALDTVVVRAVASDRLAIEYGRVRAPWLQLDMAGTIGLRAPHPLTLNLQWSAPLAEQPGRVRTAYFSAPQQG